MSVDHPQGKSSKSQTRVFSTRVDAQTEDVLCKIRDRTGYAVSQVISAVLKHTMWGASDAVTTTVMRVLADVGSSPTRSHAQRIEALEADVAALKSALLQLSGQQ